VLILHPLFTDMAQFLCPEVAPLCHRSNWGTPMRPSSFRIVYLWRTTAQRLAFAVKTIPHLSIPPHPLIALLTLFCHIFINFPPRSHHSYSLSTSSFQCLLFTGHPIEFACVPLIKIFLPRFQCIVLPVLEHPDNLLSNRVSLAWVRASFTILSPSVLFQLILLG
jgi:hypothetical protein